MDRGCASRINMSLIDQQQAGFHHVALFYASDEEYLGGTIPFIEDGLASGEPVLVVLPGTRLQLIREALGDPAGVTLRAMERVGRNPAWIIPAWADFLADHRGSRVRGIGEPIWPDRTDDELAECVRHEALLNLAFADASGFTLLCPYDLAGLRDDVVATATATHPQVCRHGDVADSGGYQGTAFDDPLLPEAPAGAIHRRFDRGSIGELRRAVAAFAAEAGLGPAQVSDLIVAVSEAATNSVLHGGGGGELGVWLDDASVVCEVIDGGRIADPMAGRIRPTIDGTGGRGLWIINQLCDLVQLRATAHGQRLRFRVSR